MFNDFIIPVTVLDNFWPDPEFLVNYSKTLEYEGPSENKHFPGKRAHIEEQNPELFTVMVNNVISLFFEFTPEIDWRASLSFQITDSSLGEGWVHRDDGSLFAFILYLNENPDVESGTSIFDRRIYDSSIETPESKKIKRDFHRGLTGMDENYLKTLEKYNGQFEETIQVKNKFNRLLVFDSNTYHGVKKYMDGRLTMVGFIDYVNGKKLY